MSPSRTSGRSIQPSRLVYRYEVPAPSSRPRHSTWPSWVMSSPATSAPRPREPVEVGRDFRRGRVGRRVVVVDLDSGALALREELPEVVHHRGRAAVGGDAVRL